MTETIEQTCQRNAAEKSKRQYLDSLDILRQAEEICEMLEMYEKEPVASFRPVLLGRRIAITKLDVKLARLNADRLLAIIETIDGVENSNGEAS